MELRVHLKICEGCGCLWYRAQTQGSVYCKGCEDQAEGLSHAREPQTARPSRPQDAGQSLGGGGSNRGCSMSAALQFPIVWGASSPQPWRQDERRMEAEAGDTAKAQTGCKAPAAGPGHQPGLLPQAYREHVAPLPVCVNAGGAITVAAKRSNRARMGIEQTDPYL